MGCQMCQLSQDYNEESNNELLETSPGALGSEWAWANGASCTDDLTQCCSLPEWPHAVSQAQDWRDWSISALFTYYQRHVAMTTQTLNFYMQEGSWQVTLSVSDDPHIHLNRSQEKRVQTVHFKGTHILWLQEEGIRVVLSKGII